MKKYLLTFVFAISVAAVWAQARLGKGEFRAVYRVETVTDPADTTSLRVDTMYLEFSSKHSVFYSPTRRYYDSLMYEGIRRSIKSGASFQMPVSGEQIRAYTSAVVVHHYPNNKKLTFFTADLLGAFWRYEEEYPLFDWQYRQESKKIGNYTCQKAVATFRGRQWEVWYTTDIPTPFGPWKFYGLPGLVVYAEDSLRHFRFELIGFERLPAGYEMVTHYDPSKPRNFVKISRERYLKELSMFLEDPLTYHVRAMSGNSNASIEVEGIDRKKLNKKITKVVSNPIELE